jgi:hypothetical protein
MLGSAAHVAAVPFADAVADSDKNPRGIDLHDMDRAVVLDGPLRRKCSLRDCRPG